MAAAMNGIALSGLSRVYGGTFLVFSDYMRPAVRLAALMKLPTMYVWTHDSIGLGEDGPTHQPIEHLASLRGIPGLDLIRPADANETAVTLWAVLANPARPAGFSLSRQDLPVFPRDEPGFGSAADAARGGYILFEPGARRPGRETEPPNVLLLATGSEVQLAVAAANILLGQEIRARVVSLPCREWFDAQEASYRDHVIPPTVRARVSVEAGISQGWHELTGIEGCSIGIDQFGASGSAEDLYEHFGITTAAVVQAAHEALHRS
jgi:transketolase